MQVHDELVFEVPADEVTIAVERVRELMGSAADLSIPLTLDIGAGANWAKAHS